MILIVGVEGVIVGIMNKLNKFTKKYRLDSGRQIAVITEIVGLPLLLAASAIGLNRATSTK